MSHDYISRDRWWGWDEETRAKWTTWFYDNGLFIEDIAEFHVHDDTVSVIVYLKNEEGRKYAVRDATGQLEAAWERVEMEHDGSHPPIPNAVGTPA